MQNPNYLYMNAPPGIKGMSEHDYQMMYMKQAQFNPQAMPYQDMSQPNDMYMGAYYAYPNYKYMGTTPYSQTPQPVPVNDWQLKDPRYRQGYNDYYYYDNRYAATRANAYPKPEEIPQSYIPPYYKPPPTSHTPNPNILNESPFVYSKSSNADRMNESKNCGIGKINHLIMNRTNPSQIPMSEFRIGVKLSKYNLKSLGNKDSKVLTEFGSALQDMNVYKMRDFKLPEHYNIPKPELKEYLASYEFYTKFSTGTLFYVFYNIAMDMCQFRAAKELLRRGWKYMKQNRKWVGAPEELLKSETERKGESFAQSLSKLDKSVAWVMFDIKEWTISPIEAPDKKLLMTVLED